MPRAATAVSASAVDVVGIAQFFFTVLEKISTKRPENAVDKPKSISKPEALFRILRIWNFAVGISAPPTISTVSPPERNADKRPVKCSPANMKSREMNKMSKADFFI